MINYLIDIDGTVTDDVPNEDPSRMSTCSPKEGAVDAVNRLYQEAEDEGGKLMFFTSRTEAEHKVITEDWLRSWGFRFHGVLYDKPRGGNYVWIDNLDVIPVKYSEGYWTTGDVEWDHHLLAQHGWAVECDIPLEIRHKDGSFATGQAAHMVVACLRSE